MVHFFYTELHLLSISKWALLVHSHMCCRPLASDLHTWTRRERFMVMINGQEAVPAMLARRGIQGCGHQPAHPTPPA